MKKILVFIFYLLVLNTNAQNNSFDPVDPINPPIYTRAISFNYDDSGNQIRRYYGLRIVSGSRNEKTESLVFEEVKQSEKIKAFPNPTQGELNIYFTNNFIPKNISILDLNGRLLKSYDYSFKETSLFIDMSEFIYGTYIIKVSTFENKIEYFKIIKK